MFLWNIGAIGWLLSVKNGMAAIFINTIIYTFPFAIYYFLKNIVNSWIIIPIWMTFELLINLFSFPTPLLTIGNSLGNQIYLIQWYKYSTVLGGSLWMFLISYFIWKKKIYLYMILLIFPILSSIIIYNKKDSILINSTEQKSLITVFDDSKFRKMKQEKNIVKYLNKRTQNLSGFEYLILPEVTINFKSKNYSNTLLFKSLNSFQKTNNINVFLFGADISISDDSKINASVTITKEKHYLTIKKKLVPFAEYVPNLLKPLYKKQAVILSVNDDLLDISTNLNISPIICYDSFFPFYVSETSKNSKIIILLSSEAFLNNSFFGKKQFNNNCKIRSIENNKPFLKCSNSGKSLLINNKGTIIDDSQDNEFYTFKIPIHLLNYETK